MDFSDEIKTKVITLSEHTTKTQREIAAVVGVSQKSVSRILTRYREEGNANSRRKNCGRKRKATSRMIRRAIEISKANPKLTSNEIKRELGPIGDTISASTLRRRLLEKGRCARKARRKPLLTKVMMKKRLQWALMYRNWSSVDWKRVIFTDECSIYIQGLPLQYIRLSQGEAITRKHLDERVKHPVSQMIWGCITKFGPGRLHFVEGNQNAKSYIDIIKTQLIPEAADKFATESWLLQHDMAPSHTAKSVSSLLAKENIRVLNWPGNSPDMNIIENAWSILKAKLSHQRYSNKHELRAAISNIWFGDKDFAKKCITLYDSIPRRIETLIKCHGAHTTY